MSERNANIVMQVSSFVSLLGAIITSDLIMSPEVMESPGLLLRIRGQVIAHDSDTTSTTSENSLRDCVVVT